MSFEEFVDILSNMTDTTTETSADQEERELRDAFRVFDKHNRGYITASDLRAVLQCLGEDLDEDESEFEHTVKKAEMIRRKRNVCGHYFCHNLLPIFAIVLVHV